MFWIIFSIIWSIPGIKWTASRRENPIDDYLLTAQERKGRSIMEILMTLSWPLGYFFVFLSPYGFWKELGLIALIQFIILPIIAVFVGK